MTPAMDGTKTVDTAFVVIAEDDCPIAELIACVVEQAGATPIVAYDGRQALEFARSCAPSLVITDLMMPRMSGDSLIATIRQECHADLPIILLSAAPYARLAGAGADAILPKPFDLADLRELIDHYLAGRASGDASARQLLCPKRRPI